MDYEYIIEEEEEEETYEKIEIKETPIEIKTNKFEEEEEKKQIEEKKNTISSINSPPLKKTFLKDDIKSEDEEFIPGDLPESFKDHQIYIKPDWKFPIERIQKNDDENLYETLRERFSIKNIISQLKRSV